MAGGSVASLASRAAAGAAAVLSLLILAHWALVHPPLADPRALEAPVFIALLLGQKASSLPPPEAYRQLNLALVALTIACAATLVLIVQARAEATAATRRLSAGLGWGGLSATYFFFLWTHPAYGLDRLPGVVQHGLRFAGYALAFVSAIEMARFFQAYPRLPSKEERVQFHRELQEERLARARRRWGRAITDSRDYPEGSFARRWRAWLEGQQVKGNSDVPFQHPAVFAVAIALAAFSAFADGAARNSIDHGILYASIAWGVDFMFLIVAGGQAFGGLQFHHRRALASERTRMDWLYGTMLVAGLIAAVVAPTWWAILILALPSLEPGGWAGSGLVALFGPIAVDVELLVLACIVALALSIFYRGAIDPRLALRRVTLFTVVGIGVALAFLVAERAVAMRLVAWLQLPPESGAFIAGVVVAVTLAPLRSTAERGANGFISRILPLATMMDGPRQQRAVVLCDLSGYTRLSARDERQAMLLAALLQRLADTVVRENGGRVVKSMGDAVMMAFPEAAGATRAILALHERFPPAAAALGLEPLPLHTGAHFGEVVETHDGDLYGQTVNIAARVQGGAEAGEAMVSEAFAVASGCDAGALRPIGERTFKNVPEPVTCFALTGSPAIFGTARAEYSA